MLKTLCAASRMHHKSFEWTTRTLLSYLDTTAFPLKRMRVFWGASQVAQLLYNAAYAIQELRLFVEVVFANVNMHFITQSTSSTASCYAFLAKHSPGVAAYVQRWGMGKVCCLENVRYEKCIRMSYLERFVTLHVGGFEIVCLIGPYVLNPLCLYPNWLYLKVVSESCHKHKLGFDFCFQRIIQGIT